MALLKRLSDGFWQYVSPSKQRDAPQAPGTAPGAVQHLKKLTSAPRDGVRRRSEAFEYISSPLTRGERQRKGPEIQTAGQATGQKRRRAEAESSLYRRRDKAVKEESSRRKFVSRVKDSGVVVKREDETGTDESDNESAEDLVGEHLLYNDAKRQIKKEEADENVRDGEGALDEEESTDEESNIYVATSTPVADDDVENGDDEDEVDDREEVEADDNGDEVDQEEEDDEMDDSDDDETELLDGPEDVASDHNLEDGGSLSAEEDHQDDKAKQLRLGTPPQQPADRRFSTEALREQGWCDDHISLVRKISMRGYEPIMSKYWQFDFRYMPDSLFAEGDDAPVNSVWGTLNRATKALEKLFGLGAWVRDRILLNGRMTPERQVYNQIKEYMNWAEQDSGLNPRTVIPLLAIHIGDSETPAEVLKEGAQRKLAKLAERYREAFRVRPSIESSPASGSTQLAYDMPTLYAIIASHTLVALVAYRPNDASPEIQSVAFFDMGDRNYDVWNALALAIIVCHVRDMQMRIAEETGLGVKHPDDESSESDDPDA